MASSFGKYQSGIEASTGNLVQASGQMAQLTANTLAGFGQNIAEGIKVYNENSQKSEAANAKIQMLGQEVANKIAMYSKDPEIAQSGILDGLIQTGKMLSEAPTKGFAQRAQIAMGAEAKLAGFGGQLQEMMFLRGREMERVSEEGLRKFAGETSVTSPRFSKAEEFKADPNLSLEENKAKALGYLNKVRASNPKLQGSDQDFLANWLSTAEQDIAKADPTKVHPTVISSMLEQIQADKRIQKSNADASKTGLVEDFLAKGKMSSKADYDKTMTAAADVLVPKVEKKEPSAMDIQLAQTAATAKENVKRLETRRTELLAEQKEEEKRSYFSKTAPIERTTENIVELARKYKLSIKEEYTNIDPRTGDTSFNWGKIGDKIKGAAAVAVPNPFGMTYKVLQEIGAFENKSAYEKDLIKSELSRQEVASGNAPIKTQIELLDKDIAAQKRIAGGVAKAIEPEKPRQTVAPIPMGEVVLGSMEETRKRTVAERQREVADFVTSRMGAIDPTDPERKRRLPVVGFDKFYKGLVPEAEIREFTTDSGIRMIHANGKWEVIKSADKMTPAEMRKANIGVFGKQTADGRLVPSEFIPDSGVFVGGLFSGSDAAVDRYQEEMPKLIDARRGIKELQRINDLVGEAAMPVERGKALVEEMNLSAMLRTDIVGVGTVSNYEQKLIKDVTENSVNFFSLESRDRAILIALAERVDRRIKNLSAAHGLTISIQDDRGMSKYQALRTQYLKEKGIL